jgi:hypothetical protein
VEDVEVRLQKGIAEALARAVIVRLVITHAVL